MSSENKYVNDQYKGFFEDSLSKTDPDPFKAISDVAIIGPIIQARGILKKSAIIALGIEIRITRRNFFVNN